MKKEVSLLLLLALVTACAQESYSPPATPELDAAETHLQEQLAIHAVTQNETSKAEVAAALIQYDHARSKAEAVSSGNEPFLRFTPSALHCTVLIHGFEASPYEVTPLADYLQKENITVYAARLSGHGTSLDDFKRTTYQDWSASLDTPLEVITSICEHVVVVGVSMGAILALQKSLSYDLAGIVTMGAPIFYQDKRIMNADLFKWIVKKSERNLTQKELLHYYPFFITSKVAEMAALLEEVRPKINEVKTPALILQSEKDNRAEPRSAQYLNDTLASEIKHTIYYQDGDHVLIRSVIEEQVFEDIATFIKQT